jgi:hypothetical protein
MFVLVIQQALSRLRLCVILLNPCTWSAFRSLLLCMETGVIREVLDHVDGL